MPIQKRVEVGYWASQEEHGALEKGIERMQLHRSIGKLSDPRITVTKAHAVESVYMFEWVDNRDYVSGEST